MSPITPIPDQLESIRTTLAVKQAECLDHQRQTSELRETMTDPELGVCPRLVRIETSLGQHKETLQEIKEGQSWIMRGIIGIMVAVIGWGAAQWISPPKTTPAPAPWAQTAPDTDQTVCSLSKTNNK